MTSNEYKAITCAENPDLVKSTQRRIGAEWPEFMLHDPVADGLSDCYEKLPDFQFVLMDGADKVVAIANSIPLAYDGRIEDLPDKGWDWALTKGLDDLRENRRPTILCALQIVVFSEGRGRGISPHAVSVMRQIAREHRWGTLVAPVRPSQKSHYPLTPIEKYICWTNGEGLPTDPWLRVHARLGASIVKPCPEAMTIQGTVAEWESWTGMSFPESGPYIVPGALIPVRIDREADRGVYIEPNVWMHHPLGE